MRLADQERSRLEEARLRAEEARRQAEQAAHLEKEERERMVSILYITLTPCCMEMGFVSLRVLPSSAGDLCLFKGSSVVSGVRILGVWCQSIKQVFVYWRKIS